MSGMDLKNLRLNPILVTRSTKFILPFILKNKLYTNKIKYSFVNAYIGDINRPWLEDKIFLVYNTTKELNIFRDELINNEHFHSWYYTTIDGESYDVFVFNIPFLYKKEINLIKNGYVTSLDISFKKKILDFWSNNEYNVYYDLFKNNTNLLDQVDLSLELIKEEDISYNTIDMILEKAA